MSGAGGYGGAPTRVRRAAWLVLDELIRMREPGTRLDLVPRLGKLGRNFAVIDYAIHKGWVRVVGVRVRPAGDEDNNGGRWSVIDEIFAPTIDGMNYWARRINGSAAQKKSRANPDLPRRARFNRVETAVGLTPRWAFDLSEVMWSWPRTITDRDLDAKLRKKNDERIRIRREKRAWDDENALPTEDLWAWGDPWCAPGRSVNQAGEPETTQQGGSTS